MTEKQAYRASVTAAKIRYPKPPNYRLRRGVALVLLAAVTGTILVLCARWGLDRQCSWLKKHGTEYQINYYCGGIK